MSKAIASPSSFTPQPTADGSLTFYSPTYHELFHSRYGARQEALSKYVEPTQLATLAQCPSLRLLDICYGLGYNTAAALSTIWAINPTCHITLVGIDIDPTVSKAAIPLLADYPTDVQHDLAQLAHNHQISHHRLQATLWLDDARHCLPTLAQQSFQADAIFLDPFSPPRCPQLWTVEFLAYVAQCLAPTGKLATYSCSAAVRTAISLAGLLLGSTSPVGRKAPGTLAAWSEEGLPPLAPWEQEHLHTRAAIPYRDPDFQDDSATILARRQAEQTTSSLEPTSRWKKRWLAQLTPTLE